MNFGRFVGLVVIIASGSRGQWNVIRPVCRRSTVVRGLKVHRLVVFFLQVVGDFFVELLGTFLGQPVVGVSQGTKSDPHNWLWGKVVGTFLSDCGRQLAPVVGDKKTTNR